MRLTLPTLLCSVTLALAASGCKKSESPSHKHKKVTTGSVKGDAMVGTLALSLRENPNLTASQQATIVKAAATNGKNTLQTANMGLRLDDAQELAVVSPAIMAGAIGALDEAGVHAADAATLAVLKGVVETIETSLLKSLESQNLMEGMTLDQRKAMVADMISDAVGALDDAGVSVENTAGLVGDLMNDATATLADAGFGATELDDAFGAIALEAMAALNDCGLPVESIDDAALLMVQQAMVGLAELELPADQLEAALTEFSASVVAGMDDAGIPTDLMDNTAKEAFADIIGSLNELALGHDSILEIANEIAAAAVAAADDATGAEVGGLAAAIAGGVVGGFDEAGLSTADIAAAAADVATACVGALSEAGATTEQIDTLGTKIQNGTIDGLSDAGMSQDQINATDDQIATSVGHATSAEEGQISNGITWELGGACAEAPTDATKFQVFASVNYTNPNGFFCLAPNAEYDCQAVFGPLSGSGAWARVTFEEPAFSICVYSPEVSTEPAAE